MIEAEQLHARILARLDMTRDMEDEELLHGDDIPKQFLMGVYAHCTTRNG